MKAVNLIPSDAPRGAAGGSTRGFQLGPSHAVLAALERALSPYGRDDYLRLRLQGTIARGTRIDRDLIADRFGDGLGALDVLDTTIAADYAAIAHEPNVRGRAVADLLKLAEAGNDDARAALRYAVAAFDGADPAP